MKLFKPYKNKKLSYNNIKNNKNSIKYIVLIIINNKRTIK